MADNQLSKEQIEQQMSERLGVEVPKKEDATKAATFVEEKKDEKKVETIETKTEEKAIETKTEEKKEEAKTEEEDTTIKIVAKVPEKSEEKKEDAGEEEIDEEKLLKALAKKTGKQYTSLDEVINPKKELSAEEKEKAKEKRDNDKVAYGLSKGLVSEKKLSKYFADVKNKKDLVFEQYWQDASAEDKTLTKAKAQEEFNEKFGLDAEEESRQYKRGMKEINSLADHIIRNEYPEVFDLERHYSEYEKSTASQQEREQEILKKAPVYKKDVEAAFSEIKSLKISRENPTTKQPEEFTIEFDSSLLAPIQAQMLEKTYAEKKIQNGWDKEEIKAMAQSKAILENLPSVVFSILDKGLLRKEMGLKGVQPEKSFTERKSNETLSAKEKAELELKERLKTTPTATAAAN